MGEVFDIPVRVYVEDTDAGGIVYYVNYLKFMERARTEWFRSRGYEKPALFRDDLMFVVHSLEIGYRKPARLDDLLRVSAWVVRPGRTFFIMEQTVRRGDEVLCTARVKVACVARDGLKPRPIPADVRERALADL
ncbi:MAG: tol-pal system-associated acyl-CoA thioesterase, partial [Gemmatimonadetes bacterium]|nr:tol-pal system-associated acyl-CoA thioesterase [Gammaproteobacteria bacterium]NIR99870.1 tol-pal system-associated acyl-CoA thioesterase [Gemmatimonadota bacterium]NIY42308.1 tol-pal system-associated acyl-CoA thioesterase [Gemmatimonadota bacterium]